MAIYAPPGVGSLVQRVSTSSGAVATGTTALPHDDTIPQNTEGDQYLSQAITPLSTTNRLLIETTAYVSHTANTDVSIALFQDSTAGALAARACTTTVSTAPYQLHLVHEMAAGTTSSTTFKIRIGGNTGSTTTFNGQGGSRRFGGITVSNITITEVKA